MGRAWCGARAGAPRVQCVPPPPPTVLVPSLVAGAALALVRVLRSRESSTPIDAHLAKIPPVLPDSRAPSKRTRTGPRHRIRRSRTGRDSRRRSWPRNGIVRQPHRRFAHVHLPSPRLHSMPRLLRVAICAARRDKPACCDRRWPTPVGASSRLYGFNRERAGGLPCCRHRDRRLASLADRVAKAGRPRAG